MDKKKGIIIGVVVLIVLILVFSNEYSEDNTINSLNYTNSTDIAEIESDTNFETTEQIYNELFGDKEGKQNYFYEQEEPIRRLITDYNSIATTKANKVEWRNNHQKARVYFDDKYAVILCNNGINVEFEFGNGKEKLAYYKPIIKDIVKAIDNTIDDTTFETSFSNAMENKSGVNTIGANVIIDINYNENPVGYLSGDYYFINISRGEY